MPLLSGWCIIALSNTHTAILIGRVVCGIAVGLMSAPAQVRVSYFCHEILRDKMSEIEVDFHLNRLKNYLKVIRLKSQKICVI